MKTTAKRRAQIRTANERWRGKDRARYNAYQQDYRLRRPVIAEAKERYPGGFLLLRSATGFYRAIVDGERIGQTESVWARYTDTGRCLRPGA